MVTPVGGGGVVPLPLGADGRTLALNGAVSHGATATVPVELAQAGDPGPPAQPHQFCAALMLPPPPFKIPLTAVKLFSEAVTSPLGAVKANAMLSWLMVFSATTVPLMAAMLWILIPVGPEVAVSKTSAPFCEMMLPIILLLLKTTAGAPAGAAWLCIATPGNPLPMIVLLITTLL